MLTAMSTSITLAILGGAAGLVGSIITAFSAYNTLNAYRLMLEAHDLTITEISSSGSSIHVFTGLSEQNKKAMTRDTRFVLFGILLLAIGFVLQTVSAFSAQSCPPS